MEQQNESIYDERLDDVYSQKKGLSVPSKAVTKSTNMPEFTPAVKMRREWSGPILDRENLVDRLNQLAEQDYEIFTILTISVSKVQIICFVEIVDDGI